MSQKWETLANGKRLPVAIPECGGGHYFSPSAVALAALRRQEDREGRHRAVFLCSRFGCGMAADDRVMEFHRRVNGPGHSRRSLRATVRAALRYCTLLCCFSASCASPEPPLRVGIPAWVPANFAMVARDLRFFNDREVEIVEYCSSIELARHFREGSLDVAALTLDFAPYGVPALGSIDVVFVVDVSQGADDVIARDGVGDLAALRGHRIAVEASPGGAHMLLRALKAGGLATSEVETVSVDPEDQEEAFTSGSVDAVVARDPVRSRLLASGAHSLYDSRRTPGQIVDVLITSSVTAVERAPALRKLIAGWLAAYALLDEDRASTVARLAEAMSEDALTVERTLGATRLGDLSLNRELLGNSAPRLASALQDVERLAVGGGLLRQVQPGRVRFNDSLLPHVVSGPQVSATGVGSR